MRVLAGIGGAVLIVLMLSEFFVTFLLPRRVKRDYARFVRVVNGGREESGEVLLARAQNAQGVLTVQR